MTNRKPPAKDWRNRETPDWTVATFQVYLRDEHERHYGIAYTTRNYGIEGRWLKSMIAEHGAEVVRKFIDGCFEEYRPTSQYPGLNFAFMFSYQRARVLPRVLAEVAKIERRQQAQGHAKVDFDELAEWL